MSACDVCPRPGRCCSGLHLNGPVDECKTALEVLCFMASYIYEDCPDTHKPDIGLPFIPLYKRDDKYWVHWCPNLLPNGRCGDYENRPYACRNYQPLDDELCAAYTNAITREAYTPKLSLTDRG